MKIRPLVLTELKTRHTNYVVEIGLAYNITFISGDSGVGKSAVYSFVQEMGAEDKRIKCFNYLDINKGYKNAIKQSKGKVFVIDNADVLLDDNMRKYISMDSENQYIIIGRNPTGLELYSDEIFELDCENKDGIIRFFLKPAFS